MFKLESYLTPWLMGYIDEYVQLRPEDFSLSLWGGDAVLNNLDLRLNVIEEMVHLPVTFKSGHIHDLRIHIPWTKLGSEPVVITINTIECVIKVRESSGLDTDTVPSSSSNSPSKSRARQKAEVANAKLPPGYLQSILNRIINNMIIVINNLVLKFVEDDIVLSINMKSAECYSVDSNWSRSFVELAPPSFILRKVINVFDLTVCLDKADTSGRIDFYQDPVLYRCGLTCRLQLAYGSANGKVPRITKFDVFCETLSLTLTDTQLPMFLQLLELSLALYYGTMKPRINSDVMSESSQIEPGLQDVDRNIADKSSSQEADTQSDDREGSEVDDEGWAQWMWSFVPAILPEGELGDGVGNMALDAGAAVFALGFYIQNATVNFRLTEMRRDASHHYSLAKIATKPLFNFETHGIACEVLMQGLTFFDIQCGVTSLSLTGQGDCPCGVKDNNHIQVNKFLSSVTSENDDDDDNDVSFISNSLFFTENLVHICDRDAHLQMYTESYCQQKFGAFWYDYLFTTEREDSVDANVDDHSVTSGSDIADDGCTHEVSVMRYLIGPCNVMISSSLVHRIQKLLDSAMGQQYEPYSKDVTELHEENAKTLTQSRIDALMEFVPTRTVHTTILKSSVTCLPADHPYWEPKQKRRLPKKERQSMSASSIVPVLSLHLERFDLQVSMAMYTHDLISGLCKMAGLPANLLHHCYVHRQMKMFGLEVGVAQMNVDGHISDLCNLLSRTSAALYRRSLLHTAVWKDLLLPQEEWLYEVPRVTLQATVPQLALLDHLIGTWYRVVTPPLNSQNQIFSTLLSDACKNADSLQVTVTGVEVKQCWTLAAFSYSAVLSSAQINIIQQGANLTKTIPVLTAPCCTRKQEVMSYFRVANQDVKEVNADWINITAQIPLDGAMPEAPCLTLLNVEGFVCCLHPELYLWLLQWPEICGTLQHHIQKVDDTISAPVLDLNIAQSSSPLGTSQVSVHSGSSRNEMSDGVVHSGTLSHAMPASGSPREHSTSHVHSGPRSSLPEKPQTTDKDGAMHDGSDSTQSWKYFLINKYALAKIMQVQVTMDTCAIFLPCGVISPASGQPEGGLFDLTNTMTYVQCGFWKPEGERNSPDTVLLLTPRVNLHSVGMKQVLALQDIPVRSLEGAGSLMGNKLPWSLQLADGTVHTLFPSCTSVPVLTDISLTCSVSVSSKYNLPTSDELSALGLSLQLNIGEITASLDRHRVNTLTTAVLDLTAVIDVMATNASSKCSQSSDHIPVAHDPHTQSHVAILQSKRTLSSLSEAMEATTTTDTFNNYSTSDASRDGSPLKDWMAQDDVERKGAVKLSFCLQCNLPKLMLHMYTENINNVKDQMLTVIGEEFVSILDLQEVYSKLQCKLSSLSIKHYVYRSGWKPGPCDGILFSSTDSLRRDVRIISNKLWCSESTGLASSPPGSYLQQSYLPCKDTAHTLFSFTFTRALCKNVHKRLQKMNLSHMSSVGDEMGTVGLENLAEPYSQSLSEICVTLQPFDFIFYAPVLVSFMNLFTIVPQSSDHIHTHTDALSKSRPAIASLKQREAEKKTAPNLSGVSLPLLYLTMSHVRVFLPIQEDTVTLNPCPSYLSQTSSDGDVVSEDNSLQSDTVLISTHSHNTIILQLDKISIVPQADNPLPREVIDKDVYHQALLSGLNLQPGCQFEDRQYQLDVTSLILSTGIWNDFIPPSVPAPRSSVQMPALDWNTMSNGSHRTLSPISLIPIVSSFDICVIGAPAMYCQKVVNASILPMSQWMLVCGQSLELNATSDLDLYLSIQQLQLVIRLLNQMLVSSDVTSVTEHAAADDSIHTTYSSPRRATHWHDDITINDVRPDSGLGSEIASSAQVLQKPRLKLVKAHQSVLPVSVTVVNGDVTTDDVSTSTASAPFSILITARRITCTLYSHSTHKSQDQAMNSTSSDAFVSLRTIPLLYMYLSQPHCLVSVQLTTQKCAVSCYDIMIKGCANEPTAAEKHGLDKVLPDSGDFSAYWLDTRSGHPDPKTGIPPSFCTVTLTDFITKPGLLSLRLERPLRITADLSVVHQIHILHRLLYDCLAVKQDVTPEESVSERADADCKFDRSLYETILQHVNLVNVETDQIVITALMDIDSSEVTNVTASTPWSSHRALDQSPGLMTNVGELKAEIQLHSASADDFRSVTGTILLHDVEAKVLHGSTILPLIGPFVMTSDLDLRWCDHSGSRLSSWPQVTALLATTMIPIHLGQHHVICLQKMSDRIFKYFQFQFESEEEISDSPAEKISESTATSRLQESSDDLKSNNFVYKINKDSCSEFPGPGEITFVLRCDDEMRTNKDDNYTVSTDSSTVSVSSEHDVPFDVPTQATALQSAMLWCYKEPRVVSRLTAHPVPFSVVRLGHELQQSKAEMACSLQFWHITHQCFITASRFKLSDIDSLDVHISAASNKAGLTGALPAQLWRVIIHDNYYPESESSTDPVVHPMTLAACLCINSFFSPDFIPALQLSFTSPSVQIHLANHLPENAGIPVILTPFSWSDIYPAEQEWAMVSFSSPVVSFTAIHGPLTNTDIQVSCGIAVSMTEYEHLTQLSVLDPCSLIIKTTVTPEKESVHTTLDLQADKLIVRVSAPITHVINGSLQAWKQVLTMPRSDIPLDTTPVLNHYLLCNDTQTAIRIGQVGTDENLLLQSREILPYSWRTHTLPKLMHMCIGNGKWVWTQPFDLLTCDVKPLCVATQDRTYTVLVSVRSLSNMQKQVIIRGQLIIASRLTNNAEICLTTTSRDPEILHLIGPEQSGDMENSVELGPCQTLPSYIIEETWVKSLKLRLLGLNTDWSKAVSITGQRSKTSRLVKLPLADGESFIHIWCHVIRQEVKQACQIVVLLAPLFVVRTHVPDMMLVNVDCLHTGISQQVAASGQGRSLQVHCLGGDISHQLTFQLGSTRHRSNPPITLSTGLIEQLVQRPLTCTDLGRLEYELEEEGHDIAWPYDGDMSDQPQSDTFLLPNGSDIHATSTPITHSHSHSLLDIHQPDINLTVDVAQCWPAISTVLLDVTPPTLFTNRSQCLLVVKATSGNDALWSVDAGQSLALPDLSAGFQIGVSSNNMIVQYAEPAIILCGEDWNSIAHRPDMHEKGQLYINGYLNLAIIHNDQDRKQLCSLTLRCRRHGAMLILWIQESFIFSNLSSYSLDAHCLTIPLSHKPYADCLLVQQTYTLTGKDTVESSVAAVTYWSVVSNDMTCCSKTDSWVRYAQLRFRNNSTKHNTDCHDGPESMQGSDWSSPIRLAVGTESSRITVSLHDHLTCKSFALVVTSHMKQGITYIVLDEDSCPMCLVHNHCSRAIVCGEGVIIGTGTSQGIIVCEEAELVSCLPVISPGQSIHYTFPYVNRRFPEIYEAKHLPRIHFATFLDMSSRQFDWSSGVNITTEQNSILNISGLADIKVHVESVCRVIHVTLEPVSKAEILAKEVRGRIHQASLEERHQEPVICDSDKQSSKTVTPLDGNKFVPGRPAFIESDLTNVILRKPSLSEVDDDGCERSHRKVLNRADASPSPYLHLSIGVFLQHMSLIFVDYMDLDGFRSTEILRINLDSTLLSYFHAGHKSSYLIPEPVHSYCSSVCIGSMQIDNQLYGKNSHYDFPVCVIRQSHVQAPVLSTEFAEYTIAEKHAYLRQSSLLDVQVVQSVICGSPAKPEKVLCSLRPLCIYLDDSFIYTLLHQADKLMPVTLSSVLAQRVHEPRHNIPQDVLATAMIMSHPVSFDHVTIDPVDVLVSVHASLKVFIASDATPLHFGPIHQDHVFTTAYQLVRSAVVQYASSALIRAGLVVGSLDALGNPTGLARHIGTGVADLLRMPYAGLRRGPGAFLLGVTAGLSSLLRNLSTGMLTSVTNFATSLSRNMDNLSLDQEHRCRQESSRMNRPEGVAVGFMQGMSGLGLSLLGAVAGLADQPLQGLVTTVKQSREVGTPPRVAMAAAGGIVSGVGKGLVGMVTKPIGGAAELVSQTGQGILQSTGLGALPSRRYTPLNEPHSDAANTELKLMWKILWPLTSYISRQILVCLPAIELDTARVLCLSVTLMLTADMLAIVSSEDDAQQQAFSLHELDCQGKRDDPSVLILIWYDSDHEFRHQTVNRGSDRIAEYIDASSGPVTPTEPMITVTSDEASTSSNCSSEEAAVTSTSPDIPQYEYRVDADLREMFLLLFRKAKNKLIGHGFPTF